MKRTTVSGIMLTLMLIGVTLTFNIHPAMAIGTIYIRADGSVDPPTAPISTADNITYFLTDSINTDYGYNGLVVERSNIIIDGNQYTLQGATSGGKGAYLSGLSNVTVQNINVIDFNYGIFLNSSAYVTVSLCNVSCGGETGGISLINSSRNTISENRIVGWTGISLESSSSNSICGNIIEGTYYGVRIQISESSLDNKVYGNYMTGDACIGVYGSNNEIWDNEIHGGSAIYLSGSGNIVSENNAGVGVSISGFGNTVYGNQLGSCIIQGVNNVISSNVIYHSGIWENSLGGSNNTVIGNDFEGGRLGIALGFSGASNCTLIGNRISNHEIGVSISSLSNNVISGNNIANNGIGIEINAGASNNYILHNNFIDNTQQVHVTASGTPNFWDAGYPSGGNYWSDDSDVDYFSGPFQNETGSDKILDHPYVIDEDNVDRYPLRPVNIAPSISGVSRKPLTPNYDDNVVVSADVVEDHIPVEAALLSYTYDLTWHNASMNRFGALFNSTIPAQPYGTLVQYKIYANDTEGNWAESELYWYLVVDEVKPDIVTVQNPTQPRASQNVKVSANVIEPVNASGVKTVFLSYRVNGWDPWWNKAMVFNSTLGLYELIIPGQKALDNVEYFVQAEDNAGNDNSTEIVSYMVALAGDANLDHIVDVVDAACISAHWYLGPPIGPLGYDPLYDLNNDGYINVVDSAIVNADWRKAW